MTEKDFTTDVDEYTKKRANRIKEFSEIHLRMLDEYGGDNEPTRMARADAQTKINFCNFIYCCNCLTRFINAIYCYWLIITK